MRKTLLMCAMLLCSLLGYAVEITSNSQEAIPVNPDYTVEINRGDGKWETLVSHNAKIFWGTQNMSFAKFEDDFSSPVEVRVTKNSGSFKEAEVRPKSYFIEYSRSGETITFTLDRPRKVSIEFDGDRWNNLFLFADELETDVPDKNAENVLWYGPGVHNVGKIELTSGQTLYLHPDALVYGYIEANEATNVRICGHGIIDGSKENMDYGEGKIRYNLLMLLNCTDVTVEDIVLHNTPTWNVVTIGCDNIHFNGIKEIGSNANSDGFDIVASTNVLIENTMQRNKDDNISVKSFSVESLQTAFPHLPIDHLNVTESHNITMRNCVLWADEAHNMLVGPEMNGMKVSAIYFENIDVLQNRQNDDVYPGVMAVMVADQGEYSDIHWENIRVEDIDAGQVISLTYQNAYAPLGYGKSLRDVTFKNVSYIGTKASPSRIMGLDAARTVENVTITNYRINGVPVTDATTGNFTVNSFAHGVDFQTGVSENPEGLVPVSRSFVQDGMYGADMEYDYAFFSDLFSFVDPLQSIKVVTLPVSGRLMLADQAVTLNQEISAADLNSLKYIANEDFVGNDSWSWKGICNGEESNSSEIKIAVKAKKVLSIAVGQASILGNTLDNFYDKSANLTIDASNAHLLDGYARVNRTSDTEEYIVVKSEEDIQNFDVLAYGYGPTGAKGLLEFEVSADGSVWKSVSFNDEVGDETIPGCAWFRMHFMPLESLPSGIKFLKVIFKQSGNAWGTQLAKIDLGVLNTKKEISIGTPKENIGLPSEAAVYVEGGAVEHFSVKWDNGTPEYNPDNVGDYVFSGTIDLPFGYEYAGSLEAKVAVHLYDITEGVAPLSGTDDFMARDESGRLLYADGTLVPESIADFADNKYVMLGEKKYLSVENMLTGGPAATEGWKVKGEGLQGRYARLQRANDSSASVTYVVNDDSNLEVEILNVAGKENLSSSVEIAETANGVDWNPIGYQLVNTGVKTANDYYALYKANVLSFSKGTKLVKVTLKSGVDALPSWAPQIIAVTSNKVENAVGCDNENLQYVGRVDLTETDAPRFIWTGSGVKTRFYGTELTALFSAANGKVAVWVDGGKKDVKPVISSQVPVSTGICEEGWHDVEFRKVSRIENGDIRLTTILCDGELALPEALDLKLEFYGNSVAEGYAAGAVNEEQRNNGLYDDHSCAYPFLVSKTLNADYHNVSISGIALTDGAGYLPYGMQSRYCLTDPDDEAMLWDFSKFVPDICVMALGINDTYSSGNVNGRTWRENYKQLVLDLQAQYGKDTKFVFIVPPMVDADAEVIQWNTTLVETLKQLGVYAYQYVFELAKVKDHPIASEQQIIAEELYRFLEDYVVNDTPSSVESNGMESDLYTVAGNTVRLNIENGDCARLYTVAGMNVKTSMGAAEWNNLDKGCYVLQIECTDGNVLVDKLLIKE